VGAPDGWDAREFTAAAGTRVHAGLLGPPDAPAVVCVHGSAARTATFSRSPAVDLAVHSPELLGPVVLVGPTVDRHARSVSQQFARLLANSRWERPSLGPVLVPDWIACGPRRYAETLAYVLADPMERNCRAWR
jgi:hypothetical protein